MNRKSPWLRLGVEGALIVVSILLAFWIQAWWEQLGERRVEQELLSSVLEDVETTDAALRSLIERADLDASFATWFYNASEQQLMAVSGDTARAVLTALYRPNTFDALLQGPLSGVLTTAQVSLVQDAGLRAAFNDWLGVAAELEERNRSLAELETIVTIALGRHEVFRLRWFNGVDEAPFAVDLRQIRNDDAVMAPASSVARYRMVQRSTTLRLLDRLSQIQRLLTGLQNE